MHPRDFLLIQTFLAATAIILVYMFFTQSRAEQHPSTRHSVLRILVPHEHMLNITRLIGCKPTIPPIHIYIFARDAKKVHRLVRSLDSAGYGQTTVNLTIAGDSSVVQRLKDWRHGGYRFNTKSLAQLRQHDSKALVILFDDHMEPSPLHALWFLIQHCQTSALAIAGGGDRAENAAGLAMAAGVWNSFIRWAYSNNHTLITNANTALVVDYLVSRSPNASMVFPSIGGGNAFVRSVWQNAAYVEHAPRLTRTWDPVKEPSWGAVEIRL